MHSVYAIGKLAHPPSLPLLMSYSFVKQVERCPRRWYLSKAQYEGLMTTYPQPISPQSVLGSIVHGALDTFAQQLATAGYPPVGSEEFRSLRQDFPVRSVVRTLRSDAVARAQQNPRQPLNKLGTQVSVEDCVSVFKLLMQQVYQPADASAPAGAWSIPADANHLSTDSLDERREDLYSDNVSTLPDIPCPSLLPEYRVCIDDPPLCGVIDLIRTEAGGDTIYEFKTGARRPEHEEQAWFYSAIWQASTQRTVSQCIIVYAGGTPVILSGLGEVDLPSELDRLRERVLQIRHNLSQIPVPALVSLENCRYCTVRQLCDDYWRSPELLTNCAQLPMRSDALPHLLESSGTVDLQVDLTATEWSGNTFMLCVGRQSGMSSSAVSRLSRLVCTVPSEFMPADRTQSSWMRLLSVRLAEEGTTVRVVWLRASELFWA